MAEPTDIAVRRRRDGKFLYTRGSQTLVSETPKFLSTLDRARMSVRVDMGLDLEDVEFLTRRDIEAQS